MEVDPGAGLSLVSERTFKNFWLSQALEKSEVRLCKYSGEPIEVLGGLNVSVSHKNQVAQLPLLVVKGEGLSLFNGNWLQEVRLDWHEIHCMQNSSLHTILQRYKVVFQSELGTF